MNINNIKNLLNAYFVENWKRDIIWTAGIMAALTLLSNVMNPYNNGDTVLAGFIVFVLVIVQRVFMNLGNSSQSIHYLMIPASYKEKVVTNMFLVNIYAVVLPVLSILIGYTLAYFILKYCVMTEMGPFLSSLKINHIGASLIFFYMSVSVFFFGAVYFRKNPVLKTFAVIMVIFFALSLISMLVLWLNVRLTMHTGMMNVQYSFLSDSSNLPELASNILGFIFCIGFIVFFYALSFLRLKETEA